MPRVLARPRNDPGQYDDLADQWWRPDGEFAALHWLAAARAQLIPPAARPDAVLVDLGCGGGLLAPHVQGYRHVGVDLVASAARVAARNGVAALQADVTRLPLGDEIADVVVAGELFEHLEDPEACVAEAARILRPAGMLVCDTINDTWWSRLSLVAIGERMPGGPPRRIHNPDLFVAPERLIAACARNGIRLDVRGLRWSVPGYGAFLAAGWVGAQSRLRAVRMLPTRSLSAVYQGIGRKAGVPAGRGDDGDSGEGLRWPTR
ncbi:MAG TPA: methyltransferase domain-containing protein [Egibacteraceae bacterium]|nr:methyltransferase domain-containing protein [Egibacteraceae bacterium]